MQFCGIICEFNPFHNGHKHLINEAKKLTNEPVVCLMSGDFVQRGSPAIQEKYVRAKNAIDGGADCVLELPTVFACSNAENFSLGAVRILSALNATHLAFGIENTNLEYLQKIAEIKYNNSIEFQNCFKNEIENGFNYNTALKRAISKELGDENSAEILSKPNNILAIEYLTAIKKLGSKIIPIAINRVDNGYNSIIEKNKYLSASGIRDKLQTNQDVSQFVPNAIDLNQIFNDKHKTIFDTLSLFKIRATPPTELEKFYDYSEGIEYRIKKQSDIAKSLNELEEMVTTPRFRRARVQKLLIYPILSITKNIEIQSKQSKPAVKVLAISKNFKSFLSETKKSKVTLIVTNKDYEKLNKTQKKIIDIDLNASNLYNTIISKQNNNDKKTGTLFL